MKIIVLEGIATSGKTSVKNKLVDTFVKKGLTLSIIEETETLMPILNNTDVQTSVVFLENVIKNALLTDKDYIIFDRLFFTHVFRTNSQVKDFKEIENILLNNSLLVFLKISEDKILERINYARAHREKSWGEYVGKKGNDQEIQRYYVQQQEFLLSLLKETSLNYKIYDTTNLDFDDVALDILEHFNN